MECCVLPSRCEDYCEEAVRVLRELLHNRQRECDRLSASSLRRPDAVTSCRAYEVVSAGCDPRGVSLSRGCLPARIGGIQACWTAVGWRMLIAAIALTRKGETPNSAHDLSGVAAGGSMAVAVAEVGEVELSELRSTSGRAEVLATGGKSSAGKSSADDILPY